MIKSITVNVVIAKDDNSIFTEKEIDNLTDQIIATVDDANCYLAGKFIPNEEVKIRKDESCSNDDPDDMCDHCDCWKHTRAMCS